MIQLSKSRWLGVAMVASAALLGVDASAIKAVTASLNLISGSCPNPSGGQYVMLAEGIASGVQVCMTESAGSSSVGECTGTTPTIIKGTIGTLNTTSYAFTPATGVTQGASNTWSDGQHSDTGYWAPIGGCTLQGFATAHN